MKLFYFTVFFLFASIHPAEVLAQKPVKVTISVPGAQDEACKIRLENYLKRSYGVLSSNVNFRRKTVNIQFLSDRTNVENIKTAIANLGYDADDVKANPESYDRLPATCKHPVVVPELN